EIKHFHEVVILSVPTQENVGWLDVAMDETAGFSLREGMTHLTQHVDGSLRRDRSRATHELVDVESVEQLHHVVERAVGGDAEIEELHCVRRSEPCRDL